MCMKENKTKDHIVTLEQFLSINSLNVGIKEYFMGYDLKDMYPRNIPDQVTYERGRLFAAYLRAKGYTYESFYFKNGKQIKGNFNKLMFEYNWYSRIEKLNL